MLSQFNQSFESQIYIDIESTILFSLQSTLPWAFDKLVDTVRDEFILVLFLVYFPETNSLTRDLSGVRYLF